MSTRLEQCTSIRKIRKDKGLKYGNVELPETFDSSSKHGYHIEYYRRFVALSSKHRNSEDSIQESSSSSRQIKRKSVPSKNADCNNGASNSGDSSVGASNSATILFPKECIFCIKAVIQINSVRHRLTKVRRC